jgi:hypothetical protein
MVAVNQLVISRSVIVDSLMIDERGLLIREITDQQSTTNNESVITDRRSFNG